MKWAKPKSRLTIDQMKKLPTKRLLNYRRLLMASQSEPEDYVWDCGCDRCNEDERIILEHRKHIQEAKEILDTREHIEG